MPKLSIYQPIIDQFTNIFRQPPDLEIVEMHGIITELNGKQTEYHQIVKITLYLKEAYYGETKVRIREWFNNNDERVQYRYQWEKNRSKPGHISAWENERHNVKLVETDPHHHHHVPANRDKRQEVYTIRDLVKVMTIIEPFIVNKTPYDGKLL